MRTQNTHPVHKEFIYSFALTTLIVAGGTGWWTWRTTKPIAVNQQPTATQPEKVNPQVVPAQVAKRLNPKLTTNAVQLRPQTYWIKVKGNKILLTPQPFVVQSGLTQEVALKAALNNLLTSPQTPDLSSTIPVGTRLLSLRVTPEGVHVDLSAEFSQGGGSISMTYRVAQIIYTATSLDSQAQVFLAVNGQKIDEEHPLGGEGLILRQPTTRQQFAKDFALVTN